MKKRRSVVSLSVAPKRTSVASTARLGKRTSAPRNTSSTAGTSTYSTRREVRTSCDFLSPRYSGSNRTSAVPASSCSRDHSSRSTENGGSQRSANVTGVRETFRNVSGRVSVLGTRSESTSGSCEYSNPISVRENSSKGTVTDAVACTVITSPRSCGAPFVFTHVSVSRISPSSSDTPVSVNATEVFGCTETRSGSTKNTMPISPSVLSVLKSLCAPLGEIIARYSRASATAARRFSSAVTFFQTNCWMTRELFVTTISRENGRSLSCAPNATTSGAPSPPRSSHVTSDPTPSASSGNTVVPPSVTMTHSASRCASV